MLTGGLMVSWSSCAAGVSHSELVKCAQSSSFSGVPQGTGTGDELSQYVGG